MLMKAGTEIPKRHDLSSLRHINSVGEPLNPEAIMWGLPVFQQAIHDNWWQTETGAMLISNYAAMDVRSGLDGQARSRASRLPSSTTTTTRPLPERTGTWRSGPAGRRCSVPTGTTPDMYNSRFRKGWYITGDRAHIDEDGYFWFVGRTDDVINTTGHLVGPFEVESMLIEHPAVVEAGVIGKPDAIAMEVVKAFVSLNEGYEPSEELRREIMGFSRKKMAAAVAPREIEFVPSLAQNPERKDHAPPAQGPRARSPRGRYEHLGRGLAQETAPFRKGSERCQIRESIRTACTLTLEAVSPHRRPTPLGPPPSRPESPWTHPKRITDTTLRDGSQDPRCCTLPARRPSFAISICCTTWTTVRAA